MWRPPEKAKIKTEIEETEIEEKDIKMEIERLVWLKKLGEIGISKKEKRVKGLVEKYLKLQLKKEGLREGSPEYKKRRKFLNKIMEKREKNLLEEAERIKPKRVFTNYGWETVKNLELKSGETFVDIGCGTGLASIMGAEEGAKAIGIDFSQGNLELAQNLAKLTELVFKDKETAENLSLIIEKESKEIEGIPISEKWRELFSKIRKIQEISLKEKKEVKKNLLDWMVSYKNLYKLLYRELEWKDPDLRRKLKETDLPKNLNFLTGDAVHLPLESSSADKILSTDVIHWIEEGNQEKAIEEIFRIAKNGATLEIFYDFGPNIKSLAKRKNIKLEEIGEKSVGWIPAISATVVPIYKIIKE